MARDLNDLLDSLDRWTKRWNDSPPLTVDAGSDLDGDVRRLSGVPLAASPSNALSGGLEHLSDLGVLLRGGGPVGSLAAFTLLRGALENAATAVWLLAPNSSDDRIARLLRLEWQEIQQLGQVEVLLPADAMMHTRPVGERQDLVRHLAASLSGDMSQITGRFSWRSIVRAGGAEIALGADRVEWLWRICSGLMHGMNWAKRQWLVTEDVVLPGFGMITRVSAGPAEVVPVLSTAMALLRKAEEMLDYRRTV